MHSDVLDVEMCAVGNQTLKEIEKKNFKKIKILDLGEHDISDLPRKFQLTATVASDVNNKMRICYKLLVATVSEIIRVQVEKVPFL